MLKGNLTDSVKICHILSVSTFTNISMILMFLFRARCELYEIIIFLIVQQNVNDEDDNQSDNKMIINVMLWKNVIFELGPGHKLSSAWEMICSSPTIWVSMNIWQKELLPIACQSVVLSALCNFIKVFEERNTRDYLDQIDGHWSRDSKWRERMNKVKKEYVFTIFSFLVAQFGSGLFGWRENYIKQTERVRTSMWWWSFDKSLFFWYHLRQSREGGNETNKKKCTSRKLFP